MKFEPSGFLALSGFVGVALCGGAVAGAPVGLQYDEIVRVVVGQATPPPPGAFQSDLASINDAGSGQSVQTPPKKHGFGNLLGAVLSGQNPLDAAAGSLTENAISNATSGMLGSLNAFSSFMRQGKVARYTFYNGWERVDDAAAHTATIYKLDQHQVIVLDLQRKTYRTSDPTAQGPAAAPAATAAPAKGERVNVKAAPQEPGTGVVVLARDGALLGPQVLDGIATTGYSNKMTMALTQATGSCRNGSFSVASSQYFSKLQEPQTSPGAGPRPAARVPTDPRSMASQGGCAPTFTMRGSGPTPPSGRFMMYSILSMQPEESSANASTFAFVTERGNVQSLAQPVAAALFEIPAGFVPEP